MDDFITDSIKYGALFLVALAAIILVIMAAILEPLFFGLFLGGCVASFVAGAIINTIMILVGKMR